MWVTEVTTVRFNPETEYDKINKFIFEHDMRDWVKTENSFCITFYRTENYFVEDRK